MVAGASSSELIAEGINQIFIGDKNRLDEVLGGQGWRYIMGAICIFPLTLIKVVDFLFRNKHLYHEPKITPMEELEGIGLSSKKLKQFARYTYVSQLEDYDRIYVSEDVVKERYSNINKEEQKVSALQTLRNMFEKNDRLEGTILRVTHHKVSDEDLLESAEIGMMKGKYLTQRVTFGNSNNMLLKTAFPLLKLRNLKGSTDTYFIFENDEVFELEMKLRNTFLKPVTIILKRGKSEE